MDRRPRSFLVVARQKRRRQLALASENRTLFEMLLPTLLDLILSVYLTRMNNSQTSSWDSILRERGAYHPEAEYFMVDCFDADNGAHIRLPFLRQEQVFQVCTQLQEAIAQGATIQGIRILPECFLDEPYANPDIVEEAIAAGVEDTKYWGASTREVLFDARYEAMANSFKSRAHRA